LFMKYTSFMFMKIRNLIAKFFVHSTVLVSMYIHACCIGMYMYCMSDFLETSVSKKLVTEHLQYRETSKLWCLLAPESDVSSSNYLLKKKVPTNEIFHT